MVAPLRANVMFYKISFIYIIIIPSTLDPCDIATPEDFIAGATIRELGNQKRFMQARPGDHLCTFFQCPNRQSQNI
jgi:hypothetical protein